MADLWSFGKAKVKIPNSSDVLLLGFTAVLAAFTWFLVIHSAVRRDLEAVGACALVAILCSAVAFTAYRRLRRLAEDRDAFLARLEGRAIEEAIALARREALALPSGLVAEKVKIPFQSWTAFERGAFQFVLAADEQGKAHTFVI